MGALLGRDLKPPETGGVVGPPIRTPLSDITAPIGHWTNFCEDFELRFLDCMEAHGQIMGESRCKFYFQDFQECTHKYKQLKRVELMRNERDRQGMSRLLNGEKGQWYADPPRMDSFAPEKDDDL